MNNLNNSIKFKLIDINIDKIWLDLKIKTNTMFLPNSIIFKGKDQKDIFINKNFKIIEITNQEFVLRQNIACLNDRNFLFGKYRINIENEGQKLPIIVTDEIYDKVSNFSKIYELNNGNNLYALSFNLNFEKNIATLSINAIYSVIQNPIKQGFKNKFNSNSKLFILTLLANIIYSLFSVLLRKKTILFYSDTSTKISDQFKLLKQNVKSKNQNLKVKIFCKNIMSSNTNKILATVKAIYSLSKASVLILENYSYILNKLNISKATKVIQLWHANEGFKAVGYSRFGKEGSPDIKTFYKRIDNVICMNENTIEIYEEVFGIPKMAFSPLGRLNTSNYLDKKKLEEYKKEFHTKFENTKDKELLLFAPTYRGSGQREAFYPMEFINLEKLNETLSKNQILLIKMHPFIQTHEMNKVCAKLDKVILLESDVQIDKILPNISILITDYSSIYSDFAFFKKPIIFYTPDRLEYQFTRGVCHDILTFAPGKVCDTFEDLKKTINSRDFNIEKTINYSNKMYKDQQKNTLDQITNLIIMYNL